MTNKRITYTCCVIMMVFGMVLSIISPMLGEISKDYSLNIAQSGMLFSVNFAGFIIFIFIAGAFADKLGKKRILYIAIIGLAASLYLFGTSSKLEYAFIGIFLIGGFGGIIESINSAYIAELNKENPDYFINLSQIFLCLGAILGPLLGNFTISLGMGWRVSYLILAITSFSLFLLLYFTKSAKTQQTKSTKTQQLEKVKKNYEEKHINQSFTDNKKFFAICICMFLYTGSEVGVWGWMATFMNKGLGFSMGKSSLAVSIFWISMTVGRIICGKLTKLMQVEKIVIILSALSSIVIFTSGIASNEFFVWITVALNGFAFSSLYPFILSVGGKIRSSSLAFSILVGSGGVGTVIVPYIMGWLAEYNGIRIAMMSPSILLLGIAFIFIFTVTSSSNKCTLT